MRGSDVAGGGGRGTRRRIVVIGAGPGGISAGYYLRQAGYEDFTIFERAGEIVRRHGAGTFVARPPRIETRLPTIVSLELAAASVSTRVEEVERSIELVTVGPGVSPLELSEGDTMWRIKRVKAVAGRRALSLLDYLPGWLVPADRIETELTTSVFDLVLAHAGTATVNVRDSLHAETADTESADLLAVPEGTLIMTLQKTVRRPDGTLIHYGSAQHVASRFYFTVASEVTTRAADGRARLDGAMPVEPGPKD